MFLLLWCRAQDLVFHRSLGNRKSLRESKDPADPDMWDQYEAKRNSSPLSSVGGMKIAVCGVVLAVALIGCSPAPEKTDAQKSFEETQVRDSWSEKFCSIQLGFTRARVHGIMGKPTLTSPVDLVTASGSVLQDRYLLNSYDFFVEYDRSNLVVVTSSGPTGPCEAKVKTD